MLFAFSLLTLRVTSRFFWGVDCSVDESDPSSQHFLILLLLRELLLLYLNIRRVNSALLVFGLKIDSRMRDAGISCVVHDAPLSATNDDNCFPKSVARITIQ